MSDLAALTDRQLLLLIAKEVTTHSVELEGIRAACSRLEEQGEATARRVDALIRDGRQDRLERRRLDQLIRGRIEDLEALGVPLAATGG